MAKIVISYRRSDSSGIAGRVFDRLAAHYGKDAVFMDVDSIPFGIDFRKHIDAVLRECDILVVLMGPQWLGPMPRRQFRINTESDPVRVEVETALRNDIPIIPVLIDDGKMPRSDQLPDSIKEFAFRNAAELDSGRDFHAHMDRLIRSMNGLLGIEASAKTPASHPPAAHDQGRPRATSGVRYAALAAILAMIGASAFLGISRFWTGAPDEAARQPPPNGVASVTPTSPQTTRPTSEAAPGPVASKSVNGGECDDIKALVPLTATDFIPIRGGAVDAERWTTSAKVRGYASCYIEKLSYVSFLCDSPPTASRSDTQQFFDARTASLRQCLGDDWQVSTQSPTAFGMSNRITRQVANVMLITDPAPSGTDQTIKHHVSMMLYRIGPPANAGIKSPEQPRDFCPDLKRAIAESRTGFESILGRKTETWWTSRLQLPGWSDCDVNQYRPSDTKRRYYSCDLSLFASLDDAGKMQEAVGDVVKSCLGSEWILRRRALSGGGNSLEFESPNDGDPNVELRTRPGSINTGGWRVKLDVNMPRS
jgi:TIR domain-containing protein